MRSLLVVEGKNCVEEGQTETLRGEPSEARYSEYFPDKEYVFVELHKKGGDRERLQAAAVTHSIHICAYVSA